MQTWLRSKLFWGILLASGAGLTLFCLGRGRSSPLPPADDAFLSYLQAANGLAGLILDPPPLVPGENRQQQITDACAELQKLEAQVQSLPPDEIQRLILAEKDMVSQASQAWSELARRHADRPSYPDANWPRLEEAFRLCRELNQANR